mmetsp:Transcript_45989/g.104458  ORF Transcript_45989/g.104458 Transcript_45989/m.104458 type:complete len:473 (+) Transcript_45989:92-1510(+)
MQRRAHPPQVTRLLTRGTRKGTKEECPVARNKGQAQHARKYLQAQAGMQASGKACSATVCSVLSVLRCSTPRTHLEHLHPHVPIVPVSSSLAVGALHSAALEHRIACDDARVVLCVALLVGAHESCDVDVGSALVARAQVHLLLHRLIHGPTQDPVADLLDLGAGDVRLFREVKVVRRGDVGVHEVGVVDGCVLGVLDRVGDVEESVEEEERHVDHGRGLAVDACLEEGAVHGELGAVAAECHAELGDELRALVLLPEPGTDCLEVRSHQELVELRGRCSLLAKQVLRRRWHRRGALVQQAQEHLAQERRPCAVLVGQQLVRDQLVDVEVRLLWRRAIANERLARLDQLPLVGQILAVLDQEVGQHLRAVLLRQGQALCPIAVPRIHVEGTVDISCAADDLVSIPLAHKVGLEALLHDSHHVRALLLRQLLGLLPDLALDVAVHGLAGRLDVLVQLGRRLVALDLLQPLGHD